MGKILQAGFIIITLFISACTSHITEYWDNGKPKTEIEYIGDSKENYFYREYYKSGVIKLQAKYENKKLHGELVSYKENGEIKSRVLYKFGSKNNSKDVEYKTGSIKAKTVPKTAEILNKAEIFINLIRI